MLFLVTIKCGHSYDINTNNHIRTLNNLSNMKSWSSNSAHIANNISREKVVIIGKITTLFSMVDSPLRITEENVFEKSSAMYIAFQCKCSRTIKEIMTLLNVQTEDNIDTESIKINKLILKTISAQFDFLHVVPSCHSHEQSFLGTLFSLNIHLNNLIENPNTQRNKKNFNMNENMNFQLINLIENFIFSNCSIQNIDEYETNEEVSWKEKLQNLIAYFDNLLSNTGLSTSYFLKYNINNNVSDKKSSKDNDLNYNIILHVLTQLNSTFNFQEEFNYEHFPKTIENIFLVQRSIFDIIMHTLYSLTSKILEEFIESNSSEYLSKKIIKEKKYLQNYQWFLLKSKAMQFPREFIEHIELILRMIDDVLLFNSIKNIQLIKLVIKKKAAAIPKTNYSPTTLEIYASSNSLDGFISFLLSITNMKYFNQIFSVLKNEFDNSYSMVVKHTQALKKIQYMTSITDKYNNELCTTMIDKLYRSCFDMLLIDDISNNDDIKDSEQELREVLSTILDMLQTGLPKTNETSFMLNGNVDTKSLLLYAIEYLRFNIQNIPKDENKLDKVKRTIYLVMNLYDKYQMYNCKTPKYRYFVFKNYMNEPKRNSKYGKKNSFRRKEEDKKDNKQPSETNSLQSIVNELSEYQPQLSIFWKGQSHLMSTISKDITQNSFHIYSYLRYVNEVLQWTVLVLFYTTLEVLDYSLSENKMSPMIYDKYNDLPFEKLIQGYGFSTITAIGQISSEKLTNPLDYVALGILLEKSIERFEDINCGESLKFGKMGSYIKSINLSKIISALKSFYNTLQQN